MAALVKKLRHPAAWFWMLLAALAIAQVIVTAAQVAQAIKDSPKASAWLKANADAVGRLAMFESSGNLSASNGTCCTGVLQMNKTNLAAYAHVTPEVYATWDLQSQVNVWAELTTDALQAKAPKTLAAMGTFDGREVTGDLVLACVQLGIGNCGKMINSGSCSGFADINGTTICKMSDYIAGVAPTPEGVTGTTLPGVSSGGTYTPSSSPCILDSDGSCMSMTASLKHGFQQGSGVTMEAMRAVIFAVSVATVIMIGISLMSGLWRNYSNGAIDKAELILYSKKAILIILVLYVVMSLF